MQIGLHISVTQMEEVHGELVGSLQVEGADCMERPLPVRMQPR